MKAEWQIMHPEQLPLFPQEKQSIAKAVFPATRYQGSKRRLVDWIWENVCDLQFDTVLDVFGGTGVVSHKFKSEGKTVTYNDLLKFNWNIGLALIENSSQYLSEDNINLLLHPHKDIHYPDFIQRTFQNIYFTDEENHWLDLVIYNIEHLMSNPYQQALARFALFQSCIIKRPYNLFHRANLYMRTAQVERSFGNKTTWDTPFEQHFRTFIHEANGAVFDNNRANNAITVDALDTPVGVDLVYLDPPYLNDKGTGVDYRDFYHFLEGMMDYEGWHQRVDYRSKNRRLKPEKSGWNNADMILSSFEALIHRHRNSILVISYRDDGIPSKARLSDLLSKYKARVYEATQSKKYALAHKRSQEILLIGL
jgi:adenine-specific DNA-methyltransferase